MEKPKRPYAELTADIRAAAYRAFHEHGHNGPPVMIALTPSVAMIFADAMDAHVERLSAEAMLKPVAEVADQMMRDQHARFVMAVSDLELLLLEFIGRQPPTLDDIRRAQSDPAPVPRSGFRSSLTVSNELRKSILSKRIGDPREPGQEG